jgi:genetic interactor of prohibitins 3, mitochondrial
MAASTASLGWARGTALRADILRISELPVFLCPALARPTVRKKQFQSKYTLPSYASQRPARPFHSVSHSLPKETHHESIQNSIRLPRQCAGCGAFSQTSDNGEPGFFSLSRRSVKEFLAPASESKSAKRFSERKIIEASLGNLGDEALKPLSFNVLAAPGEFSTHWTHCFS